jgi:hypothetical protein
MLCEHSGEGPNPLADEHPGRVTHGNVLDEEPTSAFKTAGSAIGSVNSQHGGRPIHHRSFVVAGEAGWGPRDAVGDFGRPGKFADIA